MDTVTITISNHTVTPSANIVSNLLNVEIIAFSVTQKHKIEIVRLQLVSIDIIGFLRRLIVTNNKHIEMAVLQVEG